MLESETELDPEAVLRPGCCQQSHQQGRADYLQETAVGGGMHVGIGELREKGSLF